MNQKVLELKCPNCNASVTTGQQECEWCHEPVVISTFNNVYDMPLPQVNKYVARYQEVLNEDGNNIAINKSLGFCYLKLRMMKKALQAFEKAIEEDMNDSEAYFYAAMCTLDGKKAFLNTREVIDKSLEYINAAIMIEPKGIYYYFLAYLKYDYFERKHFKTTPDYTEVLETAISIGLSEYDVEGVYTILGVTRPDYL